MKALPTFTRHLVILLIAQAIAGSAMPALFLISGLVGPGLAPSLKLSTLPMSCVVIGVALSSPLAGWTMGRMGRKRAHLLGLLASITGFSIGGLSLAYHQFVLYCVGCLAAGCGSAFNNQFRFTAADRAGDQKALVHSWVLMFTLFAAFVGPWMAIQGRELLPGEYTGSMALALTAVTIVFFLMLALPEQPAAQAQAPAAAEAPRRSVLRQGRFWLGAITGASSYATMTLLMSATPLQMHEVEHFSHGQTTHTIQSHIIAMYLPSLFSGALLSWLGVRRLIALGITLFLICMGITRSGAEYSHYWWTLVLLGVGWNFLFLASSTWMSLSFSGPDRFAAQGASDAITYGMQSLASLAAGWLLFQIGWKSLALVPLPLLAVLTGLTIVSAVRRW